MSIRHFLGLSGIGLCRPRVVAVFSRTSHALATSPGAASGAGITSLQKSWLTNEASCATLHPHYPKSDFRRVQASVEKGEKYPSLIHAKRVVPIH